MLSLFLNNRSFNCLLYHFLCKVLRISTCSFDSTETFHSFWQHWEKVVWEPTANILLMQTFLKMFIFQMWLLWTSLINVYAGWACHNHFVRSQSDIFSFFWSLEGSFSFFGLICHPDMLNIVESTLIWNKSRKVTELFRLLQFAG